MSRSRIANRTASAVRCKGSKEPMKNISMKLTSAFLAGLSGMISLSAPVNAADAYENAIFPLRTMCITQIAFEGGNGGSHGSSYHMDCSGKYEEYAAAPFTGQVVYTTVNYGLVLFQSCEPVHYADGSLDYMTVIFMHCANTDELAEFCAAGTVIPQGTDLIRCGGIGRDGIEEYVKHFDIGIYRGMLSSPNGYAEAGGYYSRLGNLYPFEGFFVDPERTVNIVNWGKLGSGNKLTQGNCSDWENCWVSLADADSIAAKASESYAQPAISTVSEETKTPPADSAAPAEKRMPEKPLVSVSSTDSVVISYQECENATYYNIRVYDSASKKIAYCVGVCEDANAYNQCRMFTDTSLSHVFEPGSYYVRVTAVNKEDGTVVASDAVSFEVSLPEYAGSGDLDGNTYVNAADIRLMLRSIGGEANLKQSEMLAADMNFDGVISAADLSILKQQVMNAS